VKDLFSELLTVLIEWTRGFEQSLWKLRAAFDPQFRGGAGVARRLDLATLVEYLYLEQARPEGLRGVFASHIVPPDLAEQCAKEFERRIGREPQAGDFDRSRLYWQQYERERGKPAYPPIGVDSIRSVLSQTDQDPPSPAFLRAKPSPVEEPVAEALEPEEPPLDALDEIHAIFQGTSGDPEDELPPIPDLPLAPLSSLPPRPDAKQKPDSTPETVIEPGWKNDWHRTVVPSQRPPEKP
jgi:hypothetical protein